ncbi:MAG: hypothetical protein IJ131_04325 [Eggerthellaceae bacterium]|nr:hypothetical protein [Eggerthellaceae bacterium]
MEQLDERACRQLQKRLRALGTSFKAVPVVLSNNHDGFVISEVLRQLRVLAASRYHAHVLATCNSVPVVSVSMDERLDNLVAELGTPKDMLLHVDDSDLAEKLLLGLDFALANQAAIQPQLERARNAAVQTTTQMANWFRSYIKEFHA